LTIICNRSMPSERWVPEPPIRVFDGNLPPPTVKNMINLNQLRVFYYAAKNLNFTRAAEKLFITQPAVTAQIKFFEKNLGLKLFKKKRGKLHLTEEGKALQEYAHKLFDCEKEIETAVEEIKKLKRGTLRIGTARTYARYFMPFLISRFREAYPHIHIHLDEGSSLELIQGLINLKNELVIISKTEENPDVSLDLFSHEEVVLILSPEHRLAAKEAVTFEDLLGEPIILKEEGSGTRKLVEELFRENGSSPKVLMETSDAEMIKFLVQHGEGLAFLVREAVASEIREDKLVFRPMKGKKMYLDVSVGYLKNQPLSRPAEAFLDCLEKLGTKKMRFQGMGMLMEKMLIQG